MKLNNSDIINKHKGRPCIVSLHGPSLSPFIDKIQELQKEKDYLRISVNQWYDYFTTKPDYWVVSNTEFTIYNSIAPNWFWDTYNKGWPKNIFNKYDVPLLFNDVADMTDYKFIEQNLKCDYLPYDSKHFQNKTCKEILFSFKEHYDQHKNFDFKKYGNNNQMWQPLTTEGTNCDSSWATFAGAWSRSNKCCHRIQNRLTLQEELQKLSGCDKHMGPGTSVGNFALIAAVLMGCDPIYVCGFDMDYSKGYANPKATGFKHRLNPGAIGHWKKIYRDIILTDMEILNDSAKLLGTKIINTNKFSWFTTLEIGDLV